MKKIIFLILLFLFAVAISPLLIGEKGYILIAIGNTTIESTVVTASIGLIVIFILLLIVLKAFRGGLRFSLGAWNKVMFASHRKGIRNFNKGVAAYILGDNQQAEHLLVKCAEPSKLEQVAYLLAASAADKQGLTSNTKHYLAQLNNSQTHLNDVGLESILIIIQLLISHEQYDDARKIIDQHHKHIGHDDRLLTLEIELSLLESRFDYVIEKLVVARKSKTIEQNKIEQWETKAYTGAFSNVVRKNDNTALHAYWNNIPRKVKLRESVVLAYCQILAQHQLNQPLSKILLPIVKKGTNTALLKQIRLLPLTAPEELIQAVQKHLHNTPHNADWLSCLAHLATHGKQWAMAEKAFHSLVNLEGQQYDKTDLLVFSSVLKQQEQYAKAIEVLQKALTLPANANTD